MEKQGSQGEIKPEESQDTNLNADNSNEKHTLEIPHSGENKAQGDQSVDNADQQQVPLEQQSQGDENKLDNEQSSKKDQNNDNLSENDQNDSEDMNGKENNDESDEDSIIDPDDPMFIPKPKTEMERLQEAYDYLKVDLYGPLQIKYDDLEETCKKIQKDKDQLSKDLSIKIKDIQNHVAKIETLQGEIGILQEKLVVSESSISQLEQDQKNLKNNETSLQQQLQVAQGTIQKNEEKLVENSQQINQLQLTQNELSSKTTKDIQSHEEKIQALQGEITTLQQKLYASQSTISQLEQEQKSLKNNEISLQEQLQAAKVTIQKKEEELAANREHHNQLQLVQTDLSSKAKDIQNHVAEIETLKGEIVTLREKLDAKENAISQLEQEQKSLQDNEKSLSKQLLAAKSTIQEKEVLLEEKSQHIIQVQFVQKDQLEAIEVSKNAELQKLKLELDSKELKISEMNETIVKQESQLADLSTKLANQEEKEGMLLQQMQEQENRIENLFKEEVSLQENIHELEGKLAASQENAFQAAESLNSLLGETKKNMEILNGETTLQKEILENQITELKSAFEREKEAACEVANNLLLQQEENVKKAEKKETELKKDIRNLEDDQLKLKNKFLSSSQIIKVARLLYDETISRHHQKDHSMMVIGDLLSDATPISLHRLISYERDQFISLPTSNFLINNFIQNRINPNMYETPLGLKAENTEMIDEDSQSDDNNDCYYAVMNEKLDFDHFYYAMIKFNVESTFLKIGLVPYDEKSAQPEQIIFKTGISANFALSPQTIKRTTCKRLIARQNKPDVFCMRQGYVIVRVNLRKQLLQFVDLEQQLSEVVNTNFNPKNKYRLFIEMKETNGSFEIVEFKKMHPDNMATVMDVFKEQDLQLEKVLTLFL